MTWKPSEIITKLTGAGSLLASVAFFSDIAFRPENAIPGLLFGGMGFFFMLRRERTPDAAPELGERVERLAAQLAATQAELTSAQERIERLGEEREFMRQLAAAPKPQP